MPANSNKAPGANWRHFFSMMTAKPTYRCKICKHEWKPRKDWKGLRPLRCAGCKSPYWDR